MLRFLKHLTNEKVIEYLSQTYLIKRAAQITVATLYRFTGDKNFGNPFQFSRFVSFRNALKENLKKELKDLQKKNGK